jgi:hypothetical protein
MYPVTRKSARGSAELHKPQFLLAEIFESGYSREKLNGGFNCLSSAASQPWLFSLGRPARGAKRRGSSLQPITQHA